MSECDKEEHDLLSEFILCKVFVTGTVDKTHLLVISENKVQLLTNVLLSTPVEFAKRYLISLLETVTYVTVSLLETRNRC